MARLQLPRATSTVISTYAPNEGEIFYDITNDEVKADAAGVVAGKALAWKDGSNLTASSSLVTATGGTTARTLADRFAEVFNIEDHGAVGNGSTDNYAAINRAIVANNAAGGGTICIPEGNFVVNCPDGVGLTGVVAGTRFRGGGRYASTLTINCTTATYITVFGNSGSVIFEDLRIVFNLQSGQDAALSLLRSNLFWYRCDFVANNTVVGDASTRNPLIISVPESGSFDMLVMEDCTWTGFHNPLLRTNTSTADVTNTFIADCYAYANGRSHLELNAPLGSWSHIYISNFRMGDQSGAGAGDGFGIAFASCTDFHIDGLSLVGTVDGEAVHIEEDCDGWTLTNFYIEVTSDEASEGDGIVLLDSNVSGSYASPKNFSISNGYIKRTGSTAGRGLWLLDASTTTPLTNGNISNVTVTGFSTNVSVQTATTSICLTNVNGVTNLSGASAVSTVTNTSDSASVQVQVLEGNRATPAANDAIYQSWKISDSLGNQEEVARFEVVGSSVTHGAEETYWRWSLMSGGVLTNKLLLDGGALMPATSGGLSIGKATNMWGSAFFGSGAVLNFNNGDVTVTHSSNLLTIGGGALAADLTNSTNLPISTGVSGLGANVAAFLATPSSANLAAALTDEVGAAGTVPFVSTGTWTPELTFVTPGDFNAAYATSQVGTYVRIGDLVIVNCNLQTSSFTHTTASGNLRMTGLPFTVGSGMDSTFSAVVFQGITKAGYTSVSAACNATATTVNFLASGSAVAASFVAAADMPTGGNVRLQFTAIYRV